ncbi:GntR family transcriptional regulator [Leucobacter sp. GX24907]
MAGNDSIVETRTLRDQVVSLLRKRLMLGEMKAGELYSATTIAQEIGVSSSPVREALLKLVDQGMLEPIRNRGFRVTPMTDQDRREVHQLRALLEIPPMQDLAGHPEVTARQGEFRALAHDMVAAAERADYIGYIEADRRFHLGLLSIIGNQRLLESVENLRDHTRQGGLTQLHSSGQFLRTAEEHFGILEALLANDPDLVGKLMVRHLEHVLDDWGALESKDTGSGVTANGVADSGVAASRATEPRAAEGGNAEGA